MLLPSSTHRAWDRSHLRIVRPPCRHLTERGAITSGLTTITTSGGRHNTVTEIRSGLRGPDVPCPSTNVPYLGVEFSRPKRAPRRVQKSISQNRGRIIWRVKKKGTTTARRQRSLQSREQPAEILSTTF